MFISQSELFQSLGDNFVSAVMDKFVEDYHDAGTILFEEGDPAIHFFTLIKGRIKLRAGKKGRSVFVVGNTGESFGWSSLVDRKAYSASAVCVEPTTVVRIHRDDFWKICAEHVDDALAFMQRLAAMLGQRLIRSYQFADTIREGGEQNLPGTGQVMETAAEE